MSLQKVLEQIKINQPYANEDVDSGPVETLNGRRGRKARAIESLKELRRQYKEEMLKGALFIVTTGSEKDAFQQVALEKFDVLGAAADVVYKDLAKRVHPTAYMGKESVSNMVDIVSRHLEDKASELGIQEYPQIVFKQEFRRVIKDENDFVTLMIQIINGQVGSELVGLQAAETLVGTAISMGLAGPNVAIVLNADEKLALDIIPGLKRLTKRVFLVGAGTISDVAKAAPDMLSLEEVNAKTVKAVLEKIRKTIKK